MDDEQAYPFETTPDDLSEASLNEVIKLYITPEGSDFGLSVEELNAKERVVRKQIASGSLKLITDPGAEMTMLMSSQEWRSLQKKLSLT